MNFIFIVNSRDLRDLEKSPVPGLGVCCPDESDPFLLHCNVCIEISSFNRNPSFTFLLVGFDQRWSVSWCFNSFNSSYSGWLSIDGSCWEHRTRFRIWLSISWPYPWRLAVRLNSLWSDHDYFFLIWFRNGHALCNDLLTNYAGHFRMVDGGEAKQASGWR